MVYCQTYPGGSDKTYESGDTNDNYDNVDKNDQWNITNNELGVNP